MVVILKAEWTSGSITDQANLAQSRGWKGSGAPVEARASVWSVKMTSSYTCV